MRSFHWIISTMLIGFLLHSITDGNLSSAIMIEDGAEQIDGSVDSAVLSSSGNGTRDDPYPISNITQLQSIASNLSAHYRLTNDIDASITNTWNNGMGFLPIGNRSSPFNGSIDGNNHKISFLTINMTLSNYLGLIGCGSDGSVIENLKIDSGKIRGNYYVGGVVGFTNGTIRNCHANVDIRANYCVGGVAGKISNSNIINCSSAVIISGSSSVGGIVGSLSGTIDRCKSKGEITSTGNNAGGMIGYLDGELSNCFAYLDITGNDKAGGLIGASESATNESITKGVSFGNVSGVDYVGGLIGNSHGPGTISNCSAHGNVVGTSDETGGLIGRKNNWMLENCFSTGTVNGNSEMGGLLGVQFWNTRNCYSIGRVNGSSYAGASIGNNQGSVENIFFNNETSIVQSGIAYGNTTGVKGKYLKDMLKNSTFSEWNMNISWNIKNGHTYPFHRWRTNNHPHIISEIGENATRGSLYLFKYSYEDIDITDVYPVWNLKSDASWIDFNTTSRTLYGIPGNNETGPYFVNVSVHDLRGGSDHQNFTLKINTTNNKPVILTDPSRWVFEDELYYKELEAITDAGDILKWELNTDANWLSLDAEEGILSGTPDQHHIGIHSINITVRDGQGGLDWKAYTLTVNETNDDPVIMTVDEKNAIAHIDYKVKYNAFDEENETLSWNMSTNATWLSFNPSTTTLSGKPGYGSTGEYWINISVGDPRGGKDQTNFTLKVIDHPIPNGSGISSDPFQIENASQLQAANLDTDADYVLVKDVNASETRHWNDGSGFEPLGNNIGMESDGYYRGFEFNGTFDGKEYSITNLWINRPKSSYIGLFGYLNSGSRISNLVLVSVDITGNRSVGGLSGATNYAHIENCEVSGRISSIYNSGGLVGYNFYTSITRCSTNVNISGTSHIGGLIGWHDGWSNLGVISDCSSEGRVRGGSVMGGLVGFNNNIITRSYSSCIVNGTGNLGGFVGANHGSSSYPIMNCYSTGNVIGSNDYIGGFVGNNQKTIMNCYSIGEVISLSTDRSIPAGSFTGTGGVPQNMYINCTAHERSYPIGKAMIIHHPDININTTSEMIRKSTFGSMGWDLTNIWSQVENQTYPFFSWQDNGPVTLSEIEDLSVPENFSLSIRINSTDPDPTDIQGYFSIRTNADWLRIDHFTGILSGTPWNDDIGTWWLNITVSDGRGSSDWENVSVKVTNTNTAPIILTRTIPSAIEDIEYDFTMVGEDLDPTNDSITWFMVEGPNWLKIDMQTGRISGIPLNKDVGYHVVVIKLNDPYTAFDTREYSLHVENTNDPPNITTMELDRATEDELYRMTLSAIDIDPTEDKLSWEIASSNVEFLVMDPDIGTISGTPDNSDVGKRWACISVSDNNGGVDTKNFTIDIINTNDPPVISTEDMPNAYEDEYYTFIMRMNDPDPGEQRHEWTFETLAEFLSINTSSGHMYGIPEQKDVGEWTVIVTVKDSFGDFDVKTFTLNVSEVNDPPLMIDDRINITIDEDCPEEIILLSEHFIDPEGDILSYDLSSIPEILSCWIERGKLVLRPKPNEHGRGSIELIVSDVELHSEFEIFVNVRPINDPPENVEISTIGQLVEGEELTIFGHAEDVDLTTGDILIYTWYVDSVPRGNGKNITLSLSSGTYIVSLNVTDSFGSWMNVSKDIVVEPDGDHRINNDKWGEKVAAMISAGIILIIVVSILVFLVIWRMKRNEKNPGYVPSDDRGIEVYSNELGGLKHSNWTLRAELTPHENGPERFQNELSNYKTFQMKKVNDRSTRGRAHIHLEDLIKEAVERTEGSSSGSEKEALMKGLMNRFQEGDMDRKTFAELMKYLND